ncbi:hypothetical protein OTK49_02335 [Vibrio coralliirubri]|uniref:hypothetical protein n=1 Tax=Vibrio coralliirubri TaxID=1516159 RepID=UPI002284F9E9|nr:hypothetical protein [Vibrio coralliirubri]MCY9861354.1 hypothetical protein [Vibrio coralliirubri]
MSPEDALKQLCSATPFSPNIEDYNQDISNIDLNAIYETLNGNDLDAVGALISYLNSFTSFLEDESPDKLMSNAAYLCRIWMNPNDSQFSETLTPVVQEVLLSAKAMEAWKVGNMSEEHLGASWFFNFVLLFDIHVYDFDASLADLWEDENGDASYHHSFDKIFKLALQKRWSVTALMAVNRFVSYYSISAMDNSIFDEYEYILEHEEWLLNEASKISVDMMSTTEWFFYIIKSDVFNRGGALSNTTATMNASRLYSISRAIPSRNGYHSRDYRYSQKMDIAPVVEHLLQFWVGQQVYGATVDFEKRNVEETGDYSGLDKIYKKAFTGKSNHSVWSRELIAIGLQEKFGQDSVSWGQGYAIADRKLMIVSEFDELTVIKEFISGRVDSIGFVRASNDEEHPYSNIIEIASVTFNVEDLSLIHKLLVGSLNPVLVSNYRGLLSTGRGYLLNCEISGVGNIAKLTKCDKDSIQSSCQVSAI